MEYCLKFKIVNLSNTVFDVHDISSIRGSSHAALKAPNHLFNWLDKSSHYTKIDKKFEGGSQIILKFSSSLKIDEIEKNVNAWWFGEVQDGFPLKYLQYVVAILPWENTTDNQRKLISHLEAICSVKKNNIPDIVFPENNNGSLKNDDNKVYCDVDNLRPVYKSWKFASSDDEKVLSHYIYSRREYGAKLRPIEIYRDVLNNKKDNYQENTVLDGLKFSQSFDEMVKGFNYNLPISLKNKMAVVFMDVNGLGKLQRKLDSIDLLNKYSQTLQAQRMNVFSSIIEGFGSIYRPAWVFSRNKNTEEGIRFETLLWGADESSWVMPSWLALEFMSLFFKSSTHRLPSINDEEVECAYSAGMVICDHKMPIRQIRSLANELRESAKKGLGSHVGSFQIEIMEGIDIPVDHLKRQRINFFGSSIENCNFTFKSCEWTDLLEQVTLLKKSFPKSQLHKLLASTNKTIKDEKFMDDVLLGLEKMLTDVLIKNQYRLPDGDDVSINNFIDGPLSGANNHLLIALYNLERLWDYVNPLSSIKKENKEVEQESLGDIL